jgi:hypothetical protein
MNESYILFHPTFIRYKILLQNELKFRNIDVGNIDELAYQGVNFVLNVDSKASKKALEYICMYSNLPLDKVLRTFIGKELSQIIYGINDVKDSVIDYFGWVSLAIIFNVSI